MLGACTPKQSRRFFSQEAAAFCCIGFPFGGSCQWPRPPTDEGQVCHSHPFAGSCNKRAPHPALRGHLPPLGEGSSCRKRCVHPLAPSARGLRPQAVGERTVRLPEIFRAMARFSPSAPSGHLPRRGRFFDTPSLPLTREAFSFWHIFSFFFALLEHFSIVLHKLVAFAVPIIL